ncbi:uracil-DNA glycosylase [Salibacteraceae bacterium]|jgi:uracil-DNA glycosylase|nr:uracil-DNA glycosylase [Salibacteraceae bacterium]MDB9709832.1 uracil-DNA glycosylase [Salibacteraceae bacterium]MDC1304519.1 uracil-DNA glycosylase [Salibacteraceae bacterium]
MIKDELDKTWRKTLKSEFDKPYYSELQEFVKSDRLKSTVFPDDSMVFEAYNLTPFYDAKVIIIGQDPYHGMGQAHGLSFSVREDKVLPPSLKNIFKELKTDILEFEFANGNLTSWANQGVLLLNSVLTVKEKSPASHQKKGWETFTDATIAKLSERREHLVFLLWGNYAQSKKVLINQNKHLVLEAAHPSPFSAHKGFFGCQHFSKTNAYLTDHGIQPIDWRLPIEQLKISGF